jgi:hypothetical protein
MVRFEKHNPQPKNQPKKRRANAAASEMYRRDMASQARADVNLDDGGDCVAGRLQIRRRSLVR